MPRAARFGRTLVSEILIALSDASDLKPFPFETPRARMRKTKHDPPRSYYQALYYLKRRGLAQIEGRGLHQTVKLTKQGFAEALRSKATAVQKDPWDGKWRLVIFDIPESERKKRDLLRRILTKIGFLRLQDSVFVSPYKFSDTAAQYLKSIKLDSFIRVVQAEWIGRDEDLRKRFKLNIDKTLDRENIKHFSRPANPLQD